MLGHVRLVHDLDRQLPPLRVPAPVHPRAHAALAQDRARAGVPCQLPLSQHVAHVYSGCGGCRGCKAFAHCYYRLFYCLQLVASAVPTPPLLAALVLLLMLLLLLSQQ